MHLALPLSLPSLPVLQAEQRATPAPRMRTVQRGLECHFEDHSEHEHEEGHEETGVCESHEDHDEDTAHDEDHEDTAAE